jgi:hypothetical protein
MSYAKTLGDSSSCGPNQKWDANLVYGNLPPGQCVDKNATLTSPATDYLKEGLAALTSIFGKQPQNTTYVQAAASPISTPVLLIGGVAVLGVLVFALRKK